jgi:hypothetical protein
MDWEGGEKLIDDIFCFAPLLSLTLAPRTMSAPPPRGPHATETGLPSQMTPMAGNPFVMPPPPPPPTAIPNIPHPSFAGDLDPLAFRGPQPPSGNLMGPQHFRPSIDPRAGVPGTVPGARFDAFGPMVPSGEAFGSRPDGRPNPDALPMPGFQNPSEQ